MNGGRRRFLKQVGCGAAAIAVGASGVHAEAREVNHDAR